MPLARKSHPTTFAIAVAAVPVLGQGGCMTGMFVSQAFVRPGPPVVTGVVLAEGTPEGPAQRLLVRYDGPEPMYGSYDFAVPLEADGRPVAPYHYAGTQRTAE